MRFLQNTKEISLHFFQQVENHPKSIIPIVSQTSNREKNIKQFPPFTKNLSEEHPCGKKNHILFIEIYRNIHGYVHIFKNNFHIISIEIYKYPWFSIFSHNFHIVYPCLFGNIHQLSIEIVHPLAQLRHVGIVEIAKKGHFAVPRSPELGQDAGLRRSALRTLRQWTWMCLDVFLLGYPGSIYIYIIYIRNIKYITLHNIPYHNIHLHTCTYIYIYYILIGTYMIFIHRKHLSCKIMPTYELHKCPQRFFYTHCHDDVGKSHITFYFWCQYRKKQSHNFKQSSLSHSHHTHHSHLKLQLIR